MACARGAASGPIHTYTERIRWRLCSDCDSHNKIVYPPGLRASRVLVSRPQLRHSFSSWLRTGNKSSACFFYFCSRSLIFCSFLSLSYSRRSSSCFSRRFCSSRFRRSRSRCSVSLFLSVLSLCALPRVSPSLSFSLLSSFFFLQFLRSFFCLLSCSCRSLSFRSSSFFSRSLRSFSCLLSCSFRSRRSFSWRRSSCSRSHYFKNSCCGPYLVGDGLEIRSALGSPL